MANSTYSAIDILSKAPFLVCILTLKTPAIKKTATLRYSLLSTSPVTENPAIKADSVRRVKPQILVIKECSPANLKNRR